jgi:hypothetical protein
VTVGVSVASVNVNTGSAKCARWLSTAARNSVMCTALTGVPGINGSSVNAWPNAFVPEPIVATSAVTTRATEILI